MNIELGKKIKSLREGRGMTQAELADKMGVSAQTISAWENGIRHPKHLYDLAKIFNVDPESLTDRFTLDVSELTPTLAHIYLDENDQTPKKEYISYKSRNGFAILTVNGITEDFMCAYSKLSREGKQFVLDCMANDLED